MPWRESHGALTHNSMTLHEWYFGNLGGDGKQIAPASSAIDRGAPLNAR
jgi:hypothetical protein